MRRTAVCDVKGVGVSIMLVGSTSGDWLSAAISGVA